jgi:hypothetical protein
MSHKIALKLIQSRVLDKTQYGKTLLTNKELQKRIIKVKTFNSRTKHPTIQSHIQDGSLTYETQWYLNRIVKYENNKMNT